MIEVSNGRVACVSEEEKHAIRMACPELEEYLPHLPGIIFVMPGTTGSSMLRIPPELQARARAVAELYK